MWHCWRIWMWFFCFPQSSWSLWMHLPTSSETHVVLISAFPFVNKCIIIVYLNVYPSRLHLLLLEFSNPMYCPFLKWRAEMLFCASVRSIALHTLAQLTDTNKLDSGPNICLSDLKNMLYISLVAVSLKLSWFLS